MQSRGVRRWVLVGLLVALAYAIAPPPAEACSPGAPSPPAGLPAPGATDVSIATSLIVYARGGTPTGFSLQAAGADVPLSLPESLGGGVVAAVGSSAPVTLWRIRSAATMSFLVPSAEHVLTASFQGGSPAEVTRFTTAAGYDKAPAVAPVLNAVHLWRVRYPVADIGSGNCVFAEYHGFITVDYVPGTVPNTPPGSVVHTFQLAPKTGGSAQTFTYVGETPFTGNEPTGPYPTPLGGWQPELDPTRTYCLSVGAIGDGDLARLAAALGLRRRRRR